MTFETVQDCCSTLRAQQTFGCLDQKSLLNRAVEQGLSVTGTVFLTPHCCRRLKNFGAASIGSVTVN